MLFPIVKAILLVADAVGSYVGINRQAKMSKLIISLTTIPPRFKNVCECLESLLDQTADIDSVNLYIPKVYRRFDSALLCLPQLPKGVNLCLVDKDLGPATKILPACRDYRGQDVFILYCDDDKIYDREWAQRFLNEAKVHPGCAICERGAHLSHPHYANNYNWTSLRSPQAVPIKRGLKYRAKRIFSLGKWRSPKWVKSGYVDILEGWGGVMVRPEFFDDSAWEIPDVLWTVDDVWLSGCLEVKEVPIWLNAHTRVIINDTSDEVEHAALRNFSYKGYGRKDANKKCISYFRQNHGIWGGAV